MATAYSSNLALALPFTGELSGTWGTTVNSSITNMLDEALGYQAYSATGGADTITIPDGTTGVARSIYIQLNGTGGGSVAVPTTKTKMYFVFNNTASAITFKVTGQTGVSIPAAAKIALVSNGTDIIVAQNYFAALTLGAALPVASGGTGLTAGTSGGILAYTAAGTLASSALLTHYGVVYGGGAGASPVATAAGTTGQVLTAVTSGAPVWAVPATSGTVTSVAQSFTGGIVSVTGSPITSSGTLALTVAGTSGGIPYFSSGTTWATSAALAANALVIGGGAGVAPSTTTTGTGVTTAIGNNTNTASGFPTGSGTATLTNKRIDPRTLSTASTATLTPDISLYDQNNLTAQAVPLTVAAPIGTPVNGNKLLIRILDNGTARAITWNATYTVIGTTLPTTTTASKMLYVGCIYNSTNLRWDVVAVTTQA